jgi:signal transduction histidine kinase
VARVKDIVTDLLVFSKPGEPKRSAFDVDRLLSGLCDLVSGEAAKAEVRVVCELEPCQAVADPVQLKQALLNIVMNAIDAMKPKGGTLTVRTGAVGEKAVIRVLDTGVGIAPEKLGHIFDPFYTDKEEGTGLGLAITHSIIEKNGGRIDVTSRAGEGTEFVIELPVS